jgi:hypothetical protein
MMVSSRFIYNRSRHHQPDGSWLRQFARQLCPGCGATCLILGQFVDRTRGPVEHYAVVTATHELPHQVGARSSQTNHAELNLSSPL